MKHVSILVPLGHTSVTNIEGTHQILSEVNSLCIAMGKGPVFNVQLVGLNAETEQRNGLFKITPDVLIDDVTHTDLIIIPAIMGDQHKAMEDNKAFMPWITEQYSSGTEIASFCIGTFFLAATGLLNGKPCATRWRFSEEIRNMFPQAKPVD